MATAKGGGGRKRTSSQALVDMQAALDEQVFGRDRRGPGRGGHSPP